MKHLNIGDKLDTAYGKMEIIGFRDNGDRGWYDIVNTRSLTEETEADKEVKISENVIIEGKEYTVTDIEVRHYTDDKAYLQTHLIENLDNAN